MTTDSKACTYCTRIMDKRSVNLRPTKDHYIPKCKDGKITVRACAQCNTIKGDMMPDMWNRFMQLFPTYWKMSNAELRDARFIVGYFRGPLHRIVLAHQRMNIPLPQYQPELEIAC